MRRVFKLKAFIMSVTLLISGFVSLSFIDYSVLAADTEIPEGYIPVYTPEDFNNIRNDLDGNYILMNDITFNTEDFQDGGDYYNNGIGWMPIGSNENPFTGVLDGNNFTVSGISSSWTDEDYENIGLYVGLFGRNKGEIKNLTVSNNLAADSSYQNNWSINNMPWLGEIAGYNNGKIINCHSQSIGSFGTITRGGLVGINTGEIYRCTNQSNLQARQRAGGIAVQNDGIIQECVNIGSIRTAGRYIQEAVHLGYAGGVAAENTGTITDCFNLGQISGFRDVAVTQIAGIAMSSSDATVKNCYNLGLVKNSGVNNPLISGNCVNCYAWDILGTDGTSVSRTVEELKQQSTYQGFDFENVWQMSENAEYPFPVLKNVPIEINRQQIGTYLSKQPPRTIFVMGEKLEMAGSEYTLVYSDGTKETRILNPNDQATSWMVYKYDRDYNFEIIDSFSQPGYYDVMLVDSSNQLSLTPIRLQCVAEKELVSISVNPPTKVIYLEGDELDLTGMSVTAKYNTQQTENITDYTVTGYDNTKVGQQTVTVSYGGISETFKITVNHDWESDYTIDKAPTCTEPGSKSHHCARCGAKIDVTEIPANGHSYEWIIDKPATEEEPGIKHEKCIVCGDIRNENTEIPMLDHVHTGITHHEAVAATCHSTGTVEYWTCSSDKCSGKYYGDAECTTEIDIIITPIDSNNHDGGTEIRNVIAATCSTAGYTGDTYCLGCNEKLKNGEMIPATGNHIDVDGKWEIDDESHWHTCQCGEIFDKNLHKGGKATCSAQAVCSICGASYGELDPDNHVNTEIRGAMAATEEVEGYTGDKWCLDCNKKIEEGTVIPKLSHTHTMIKIEAKPATCEEDGNIEYYICDKCGKIYNDEIGTRELTENEIIIKATGHNYSTEWKYNANSHWHECTCGKRSDEGVHIFGEWKITKSATDTANGSRERTCTVCGYKQSEIVNATGESSTNNSDVPGSPNTGDNSNVILWLALIAISGCGAIVAGAKKNNLK